MEKKRKKKRKREGVCGMAVGKKKTSVENRTHYGKRPQSKGAEGRNDFDCSVNGQLH